MKYKIYIDYGLCGCDVQEIKEFSSFEDAQDYAHELAEEHAIEMGIDIVDTDNPDWEEFTSYGNDPVNVDDLVITVEEYND